MTQQDSILTVGSAAARPGERATGWLPLGTRPDGTPLGIPVVVLNGSAPGPRLSLIAGVHGDEYDCVEGLRRFLAGIDPADLSGSIVATTQANPTAFEYASRHNPIDHLDLNRSFPGRDAGFLTERVGAALSSAFIESADYLLDLHSGGMVLGLVPFVGFDDTPGEVGEASLRLAKATGIETLYASVPFKNVLRLAAAERGVPSILVEIGSEGRMKEHLADYAAATLRRVAVGVGVLPGEPATTARFRVVRAASTGEFLHADNGGFLLHAVELGQIVEEGDLLGRIVDPFGDELEAIHAPHAGFIAELRTIPATRIGDWTYAVLPVVGELTATAELAEMRSFA
ncbi:MAG: hypothetical protein HOQ07_09860 [Sinomonas sp.]|nr:hypothetical protein [Sinomonas sp.]